MSETLQRWWWVRHAPVVGPKGVLYGADAPADVSDTVRIARLAKLLPTRAAWLTSGLRRTLDTYGALRRVDPSIPRSRLIADFNEQDFGAWTSLDWNHIPEDDQDIFWADPINTAPPKGEAFAALAQRVHRRIEVLSESLSENDIVVIGHSGPIRAALAMTFGGDLTRSLALHVDHLSLTRIDVAVCSDTGQVVRSYRQVREAGVMPALPPQL